MKEKGTYRQKAEKTVLHQLVQALIREEVFPCEWRSEDTILLYAKETITIQLRRAYLLGHLDIKSITIENQPVTTIDSLLESTGLEPRFSEEIRNSVHNYALALESASLRRAHLPEAPDVFDYVYKRQKQEAAFSPLTFLEQWVIQGHTIHPGSRTRMGLTDEDVKTYAPEWKGQPRVIPIAVRDGFFHKTGASPRDKLFEEYPEIEHAFYERGIDPEEYELIPVHPWQWKHTIQVHYEEAIKRGDIIALDRVGIDMAALISFRTLAPLHGRKKHHIKTAVNVQMTSAVRTVSPAATKNGPTLSKVLPRVFEEMPHPITVMKETAGIHYDKGEPFLQKNLSAILRENPERTLEVEEVAIPAAVLVADSPFTEQLVMEDLMKHQQTTAARFIRQYANVLLPGLLTLITKYGISMEAHLQNVVVVFEDAVPKRAVLRDYGGVRVMNNRLQSFAKTEIDPSTNLLTEDPQELINIFSHALLHNHFGEMIVALSRKLDIDEASLWAPVIDVVRETYEALRKETPHAAEDEQLLHAETLPMKSLVKMRLSDRYTDNMYVQINNPLRLKKEVSG
ncbi:IucA/IucC family protein [Halobacillus salinus]|uniref:IucA/IucC family protein n=1 Tax=Halobacillus salinus TaxID=192814 RepID=UPI0009A68E0E|nr:IucA/IucC family protein [Halobacillus salinus]